MPAEALPYILVPIIVGAVMATLSLFRAERDTRHIYRQ